MQTLSWFAPIKATVCCFICLLKRPIFCTFLFALLCVFLAVYKTTNSVFYMIKIYLLRVCFCMVVVSTRKTQNKPLFLAFFSRTNTLVVKTDSYAEVRLPKSLIIAIFCLFCCNSLEFTLQ